MNTTITISKELKANLDMIGLKSESYNDIVQKLYDHYHKQYRKPLASFVHEQLTAYETELTPVKKAMLREIAKGNSKPWSEVKQHLERD
jgi:hypothetical protein